MNPMKSKLNSILPDLSGSEPFSDYEEVNRQEDIQQAADSHQERKTAAEIARLKLNAKNRLASLKAKPTPPPPDKVKAAQEALNVLEDIDKQRAEPLRVENVAKAEIAAGKTVSPNKLNEALKLQGASRNDVALLMKSLNINTSVQLTKQDTQNLLACLLTCNETQLKALMSNAKVPIVIKTVIKRLLDDVKVGSIDTIEKLWDRIFGKTGLVQAIPEAQAQMTQGLIPNVPVSREAYIVIRDTLMQG